MTFRSACVLEKTPNVAVIQAKNLTVQIGEQNNVYLCDQGSSASPCDHRHAERADDVLVTDQNGVQSAIG